MAKSPAIPTEEKIQGVKDRLKIADERCKELTKKKIDPIYYELAGKVSAWLKESRYVPWILELLMPVDAARLAFRLPDPYRDPSWGREHLGVTEQLAKEVGLDTKTADKYLKHLFDIGFLNPTRNGYQTPRGSQAGINGLLSNHRKNNEFPKDDLDALLDLEWCYCEIEMQENRDTAISTAHEIGDSLTEMGMGMGMIRPRWKAIKDLPGVLPSEDWREIAKAHERFAVLPCRCAERARGHECGCTLDRCMVFDRGADIWVNRGAVEYVTLKEILDIYDDFGKSPLFNLGGGGKDAQSSGPGCMCHWDCCLATTNYYTGDSPYDVTDWVKKSRFRAIVDPEKCIGCRVCVDERCQFYATEMKYYPEFGEERAYINEDKCVGCGLCVETCTVGVRGMKIVEPPEYTLKVVETRESLAGRGGVSVENILAETARQKAERETKEKK
ncbi:DUF362 domain-containing protein [Chloroflexota bacterium]